MKRYRIWAVWIFLAIQLGGCGQSPTHSQTDLPTVTVLPSPTPTESLGEGRGEATRISTVNAIPVVTVTDVMDTPAQETTIPGEGEIIPPEDIQVVRLTFNDQWGDIEPVWSPDGNRLLSSRRVQDSEGTYTWDLYLMNPDGSGQRRLTDTTKGIEGIWFRGTWSPDGTQIAVAIRHGNGAGLTTIKIYTMPLVEEGSAPLTFEELSLLVDYGETFAASDPAWSPDGEKLAFRYSDLRLPGEERGSTIALLDLKSGEITDITDENQMYAFDLSWSPDNERIAFAADPLGEEEIKFYIFLVDVNSGEITQLTFHGEERHPTWSPDGNWIVFTSEENSRSGLYLVHVDSGKIFKLIEDTEKKEYYHNPNWSPDGNWIAFSAFMDNEHSDIYLLDMSWLEMNW